MNQPAPHVTLAERCAMVVQAANQLTGYFPFTIVDLTPDQIDERVGFVRIRHDEGWEREAVTAMPMLCPATVAEAAIRAFMYANAYVSDGPEADESDVQELDEADTAAPQPRKAPRGGLH